MASLERFIEEKCRSLFLAQRDLEETHGFLQSVLGALPNVLIVLDSDGRISDANAHTVSLSGYTIDELLGIEVETLVRVDDADHEVGLLTAKGVEASFMSRSGEAIPVLFRSSRLSRKGKNVGFVCIATDLRDRQSLETKLRETSRLESVGQLSAGVAHELNTPIQFVSDSIEFLADAFEDLERVRLTIERTILADLDEAEYAPAFAQVAATQSEVDFDFLIEEIPEAVRRCRVGTQRVSSIVKAMKRFTHPGSERMAREDVNAVLDSASIMARGEYKYCAELELELATLPPIPLDVGQLNQAILNLVVNASHAIEDAREADGRDHQGRIRIASRAEADCIVIEVEDDGVGMSKEVRERIFDPFFTTKGVGRGTGQGLGQVWSAVVERHKGSIEVDSERGRGTRFEIRLPLDQEINE